MMIKNTISEIVPSQDNGLVTRFSKRLIIITLKLIFVEGSWYYSYNKITKITQIQISHQIEMAFLQRIPIVSR